MFLPESHPQRIKLAPSPLFTPWRWRHDDQLPDWHYWRMEGLNQIRAALDRYGPNWA